MIQRAIAQPQKATKPSFTPVRARTLQRCGANACPPQGCSEDRKRRFALQRYAAGPAAPTTAPPIVDEVLRSPGRPLDPATRAYMEPRFGHDFSHVRVHSDARAADSARAVNALAYTVGRDVVFGAGLYAPGTTAGRRLLEHELTHVIQQNSGLAEQIQRQAAGQTRTATASEQREFALEQRRFVREAIEFLQAGTGSYRVGARIDDARLRRQLVGWKETLEKSLGVIQASLNKDATLTRDLRQAYKDAVQAVITAAALQLKRTSHDLYQSNLQSIHEWAWPQAVAAATPNELIETIPAGERQRIRVITTGVTIAGLDSLFSTQVARTTIPVPPGVTVRFASRIPRSVHDGLRNVAGTIAPSTLEVNSTITLALDLERYGGGYSTFRFTYVEHRPTSGTPTQEILIELLGSIGIEALPPSQVQANRKKFNQHKFRRGSGWSEPHFQSLLAAIAQVPDPMLTPVDGITFRRSGVHPTIPDAGGQYEPKTHAITMFDLGFNVSQTRTGIPGAGLATEAVRSIVHEIGHAIDLLPLRQAWTRYETLGKTLQTAFAQFESPPGSGQYQFPSSMQATWNTLQQQITAAEQARDQARSPSGERWQLQSGVYETVQGGTGAGQNAFRLAAQQDGGIRITRYSDTEWGEHFTESFSLYITDPGLLQRLRPNVYRYLMNNYPR